MPEIGQTAPNFTLYSSAQEAFTLDAFRGEKNVVLVFYPAAFTGVCKAELCSFQASMGSLNDASAQVLAISVDGPHPSAAFAAQNGIEFPILSDITREVITAYGVTFENFGIPGNTVATRSVFVIDKQGTLRWSWLAPNPGVQPDYDEVLSVVAGLD
jgi:peroxiredoxin